MEWNKIHMSFSYAAITMNEDFAGGGDFAEQLSTLIFKKKSFLSLNLLS